jgi:hypothetical protein
MEEPPRIDHAVEVREATSVYTTDSPQNSPNQGNVSLAIDVHDTRLTRCHYVDE